MKNKKAEILAEEVVKIVLAVVCIIILIILAAGLYGIFTKKTDLEQARATLKEIVAKIDSLGEGEQKNVLITSPKDWYIVGFSKGENMPFDCNGENCICICERYFAVPASKAVYIESPYSGNVAVESFINIYKKESNGVKNCETSGTCKSISQKPEIIDTWFTIKTKGMTWGSVISEKIQDTKIRRDNIGISSVPLVLFISKEDTIKLATSFILVDVPEIKSSVETIKPGEPFIESVLTEDEKNSLYNFLENKSIFKFTIDGKIEEQELAIKDQIIFYYNFFSIDNEAKKTLSENIKNYFSNYRYPIKILFSDEENQIFLEINSGKDKVIEENEKLLNWPNFIITYPGLKKVYVKFELIDKKK
jgi:hypothetical protein